MPNPVVPQHILRPKILEYIANHEPQYIAAMNTNQAALERIKDGGCYWFAGLFLFAIMTSLFHY